MSLLARNHIFLSKTITFSALTVLLCSPFQPAFSVDPLSFDSPHYQALHLAQEKLDNGQPFQARQLYQTLLNKRPLTRDEKIHTYQQLAVIFRDTEDYQGAQDMLDKALKLNPNNASTVAEIADTLHAEALNEFHPRPELLRRAEEMMTNAQRLAPNNPTVVLRMGDMALRNKNPQQASQLFEDSLNSPIGHEFPLSTYSKLLMAELSTPSGQNQNGLALLQALDTHPEHPDFLLLMARWMSQQHRPKDALEYALLSEKHDDRVLLERLKLIAQQYEQLGDTHHAISFYEQIARSAPEHLSTLTALGELGLKTGNNQLVQTYYHRAIRLQPSLLEVDLQRAGSAFRRENLALAQQEYTKVLQLSDGLAPDIQARAAHGLANTLFLAGYYRQPVHPPAELRALLRQSHDPALQLDLVKVSIANFHQAQTEERHVLEFLTQQPNPLISGQAYFLLRQYPQANQQFDAVDGHTAQGYLEAGDQLLALQALTAATTLYQRGYEIERLPELAAGLQMIRDKRRLAEERLEAGNRAFSDKDYTKAKAQYLDAQKIYPDWEVPYLRLGDTHDKLKEYESAYYAYTQALQFNDAYLSGKPFAKRYEKLKRITEKAEAKRKKS